MDNKINLALSFDSDYTSHFFVVCESILSHHDSEDIRLHLILFKLNTDEINEVKSYLSSKNIVVTFYSLDNQVIEQFEPTISHSWSLAVYLKMFFPLLVSKDISRLLYIDVDTVVNGNLKPLLDMALGNYPLGAVYDCYVGKRPDLGIDKEGNYFNSGVMVFNVPKWNELNITEKAIDFATKHPQKIKFVDQDALNAVLVDKWLKIDKIYNLLYSYIDPDANSNEYKRVESEAVIIHFTLEKPWHFLCQNRFRKLYKKYWKKALRKKTPLIVDFSIDKIPALLKLRIREWYLDQRILRNTWKTIKTSIRSIFY